LIAALAAHVGSARASVTTIDDHGESVRLAQPARRVISLAPHLTEILYATGAGHTLVGALDYSDYPPEARTLPRVGNESGIDLEAVLALKPDLIVAWPSAGSRRAIDRLAGLGIPVYRSEPRELEDIATTLERLGRLTGSESTSTRAAKRFRDERTRLELTYSRRASVSVFYEVWDRPLQTINGAHVISKVIRLCGGRNVFDGLPTLAPEISTEAVVAANPEMIVASGVDAGRPQSLDHWRVFRAISAASNGNLFSIPPDLIQRQTPRLLTGAARLCEIIDEVRRKRRTQ
jgi:iron complex transport system substrate-binding protein